MILMRGVTTEVTLAPAEAAAAKFTSPTKTSRMSSTTKTFSSIRLVVAQSLRAFTACNLIAIEVLRFLERVPTTVVPLLPLPIRLAVHVAIVSGVNVAGTRSRDCAAAAWTTGVNTGAAFTTPRRGGSSSGCVIC